MYAANEMMVIREDLISYISDAHKDAHGFRPRGYLGEYNMSIAELEVLAARIEREVEESIEEDRAREEQAMAELETYIQNWIDIGAKDRDTAIRWILDSVDHGGDFGYACYLLGLPYKMENEFARVMEAA